MTVRKEEKMITHEFEGLLCPPMDDFSISLSFVPTLTELEQFFEDVEDMEQELMDEENKENKSDMKKHGRAGQLFSLERTCTGVDKQYFFDDNKDIDQELILDDKKERKYDVKKCGRGKQLFNLENQEYDLEMKIEDSKRKLREHYQRIEDAKKQRTVKILELNEIPKNKVGKQQMMKKSITFGAKQRMMKKLATSKRQQLLRGC